MSKRVQAQPAKPKRQKWDRKQWLITIAAVVIALTFVVSAFIPLLTNL